MNIYHISDLHLRTQPKHNELVADRLKKLKSVMAFGDVLVVTGDITDDGHEAQYAHALELLKPFKGVIVTVPGNHDYGPWGNIYSKECVKRYAKLRAALGCDKPFIFSNLVSVKGEIIMLDTCLRTTAPIDFAQGKVGWLALKKLVWKLKAIKAAGARSVIAMHHSPYEMDWVLKLQDSKEFLRSVLGLVDVLLFGHEHRTDYFWFPPTQPPAKAVTHVSLAGAFFKPNVVGATKITLTQNGVEQ
jgi:3',5'-cyclic AMP phosphodiesterase CpdA